MTKSLSSESERVKFRRAKPVRLFEQAVAQIKNFIIEGRLQPGDRLPSETELSEMLEISRASIREALRALESKGYITVRSGSGTYVAEESVLLESVSEAISWLVSQKSRVLQLLQVRSAIEVLATSLAAQNISDDEITALEAIIERQERLIKSEPSTSQVGQLAKLDKEFHLSISRASRNELIEQLIFALVPSFQMDNQALFMVGGGLTLVGEHRAVLEALKARDGKAAGERMEAHIERVLHEVEELRNGTKNEKSGLDH